MISWIEEKHCNGTPYELLRTEDFVVGVVPSIKNRYSISVYHLSTDCPVHVYGMQVGGKGERKVLMAYRPIMEISNRWKILKSAKKRAEKIFLDLVETGCPECKK